jgi:hypothetical protein
MLIMQSTFRSADPSRTECALGRFADLDQTEQEDKVAGFDRSYSAALGIASPWPSVR